MFTNNENWFLRNMDPTYGKYKWWPYCIICGVWIFLQVLVTALVKLPLSGFEFTFILIAYIIWFNVMSNRIRRKTWNMTWREREDFKEKLEEEYKANPSKTFKEIMQIVFKKLLGEEKKVED